MTTAKNITIAVLGATGELGRIILQSLAETGVPVRHVRAIASQKSKGALIGYGETEDELQVESASSFDYSGVDVVISALGAEAARQLLPGIAKLGVKVIDTSPAFRMDPDVPMVVAGVNADVLAEVRKNMVCCPDAITAILCTVLHPLHEQAGVKRVVLSTYQSTSSAGRAAMDELFNQTRAIYVNDPIIKEQFTKQIAFNAIPQVGVFREDGHTEAEFRLAAETKRLLDSKIKISSTAVRVAAFLGTALALNVECEKDIDANVARTLLRRVSGISVVDHKNEEGLVTLAECGGEASIYVSRLRDDATVDSGVSLWVVADDTRVGVAQNAVSVALSWVSVGFGALAGQTARH